MSAGLFVLSCLVLAYTGFCRLVHTSVSSTAPRARAAIWLLTVAALAAVVAVLTAGYEPGWPGVALVGAMAAVQAAGAALWRDGVPPAWRRDGDPQ